jgi:hypothetical protein
MPTMLMWARGRPTGGFAAFYRGRPRLTKPAVHTIQPASAFARSNTPSIIGSVNFPVNVFCWLG